MPITTVRLSTGKKLPSCSATDGAKGMAHIGVLKVLEQAGIPVDIEF